MYDENNNNQEPNTQNESENNNSSSNKKSSITESKGKWGKRKGDTYKFSKGIKSLDKTPVYPHLLYKKSQEKSDDNNKKIVVLKLVGQDQTVEFFKDDLYKNFGRTIKRKGRGGKSHSIWCNNDEFQIVKNKILPIFQDEEYLKIFKSCDINSIKETLDTLKNSRNNPDENTENIP